MAEPRWWRVKVLLADLAVLVLQIRPLHLPIGTREKGSYELNYDISRNT